MNSAQAIGAGSTRTGPDLDGSLAIIVVSGLTLFYAWYVYSHSDFINDDLDNFRLLQGMGFWEYFLTPTNLHHVPLHRLLSWSVYHLAPMRYEAAVLVLVALHAAATAYVYAILRRIGAGGASKVLACCYAGSLLVVYGMLWWAHAQHRLPYVLFGAMAIYHYLSWIDRGGRWNLCLVAIAYVGALLAYEIAVLLPVYMLVFGLLGKWDRFRENPVRAALPACVLLLASIVYVVVFTQINTLAWRPTPLQTVVAELRFIRTLAVAIWGVVIDRPNQAGVYTPWINGLTAAAWIGLVTGSIYLARGSWKIWAALLFVLALGYLPISLTDRIGIFGDKIPYQYRMHFEQLYPMVLFAGLIWTRIAKSGRIRPGRRHLRGAGMAAVVIYCGLNLAGLMIATRRSSYDVLHFHRLAHDYMRNLRRGLAQIDEPSPEFESTPVPRYMSQYQLITETRQLLPLFVPQARFDPAGERRHVVDINGNVSVVGIDRQGDRPR